jgi:hypothetical protein
LTPIISDVLPHVIRKLQTGRHKYTNKQTTMQNTQCNKQLMMTEAAPVPPLSPNRLQKNVSLIPISAKHDLHFCVQRCAFATSEQPVPFFVPKNQKTNIGKDKRQLQLQKHESTHTHNPTQILTW